MAKITWFNKTASTPVEWMLSVHHQQPSTGSLPAKGQHTEPRTDRCEAGIRCLGFTGAVTFTETDERDLDVFIGD